MATENTINQQRTSFYIFRSQYTDSWSIAIPLRVGPQNQLFPYLVNWYYIETIPTQYYTRNILYYTCTKAHIDIVLKTNLQEFYYTYRQNNHQFTFHPLKNQHCLQVVICLTHQPKARYYFKNTAKSLTEMTYQHISMSY